MTTKEMKKIEVATTMRVYRDTLDEIRTLASIESRDTGEKMKAEDWLRWIVRRAYEAKVHNNKRK